MRRLMLVMVLAMALLAFPPGTRDSAEAAQVQVTCSNTTGDDERINSAIAASAAGSEIVLQGTCLINGTIKLLDQRTYRGEHRDGTVIRQADGANLAAMLASGTYLENTAYTGGPVTIRSLTLVGNKDKNPSAGDALVIRSWQTVVEDMAFLAPKRHAIRLTNLSANGTAITNTQVNGRIVGNHFADSGGSAVFVEDVAKQEGTGNSVTDWQLLDNWIEAPGSDAIALQNAAGWMVLRNHIYEVRGAAIRAERMYGTTISDNYIEDFAGVGLEAQLQGDAASTVANNRIFQLGGGTGTFLSVFSNYGVGNASVTGNTIRGNGTGVGIDYQVGRGTGLAVGSTGNLVTGVTTPRRVGTGVTVSAGV